MLLIDPPFSAEEWMQADIHDASFRRAFREYCRGYEAAVLALPRPQLEKILNHLLDGIADCDFGPEVLHVMVEREVKDRDFEPSSKVATLVVLRDFVQTLERSGVDIPEKTRRLYESCDELIPAILILAISDHFGLLQPVEEERLS